MEPHHDRSPPCEVRRPDVEVEAVLALRLLAGAHEPEADGALMADVAEALGGTNPGPGVGGLGRGEPQGADRRTGEGHAPERSDAPFHDAAEQAAGGGLGHGVHGSSYVGITSGMSGAE